MPAANWNGKLQSVGNGAWAGTIGYAALGAALSSGYATTATDTGHVGNTAKFVPGHPEKMIDYGYRAVHEMTVAAKAIIAAFYGNGPRLSYWNGCSTGGRQGLMEALRYPADYDGIIAGAPVNYRTHQLTWELWVSQAVHRDAASYIPPAKYPAIHQAALDACDARDGVKDGLIDDPTTCRFDPKVLECKSGDSASCLTPPQVIAAQRIYAPAVNPRTRQEIFPALQPGSELGWGGLAGPTPVGEAVEFFQYVVYNDPSWDPRTIEFDSAADAADKAAADVLNVTDPNLKPFFDRGGKLLLYHGWNDQLVAPLNSVNYYKSIVSTVGPAAAELGAAVHDARHEPLRRRRRSQHVRSHEGHRAVGRTEADAEPHRCVALDGRQGRSHAAAVRVSRGRALHRYGQHRRGRELRVQDAMTGGASKRTRPTCVASAAGDTRADGAPRRASCPR